MQNSKHHQDKSKFKRYKKVTYAKSPFDGSPTLVVNRYVIPNQYVTAVADVKTAFRQGIPFNRAVDQVYTLDSEHLNRDKLAEHTLRSIANEY